MKKTLLFLSLILSMSFQAQNFWTEVTPFPNFANATVSHISIVDENVVWVTGNAYLSPGNTEQKWSYSTDGGYTWTSGIIDLGNPDLVVGSIVALSNNKAYVSVFPKNSGSFGGVWVTEDAGTTWTNQPTASFNSSNDSFANFIHFWDSDTGVVVGDPVGGFFEIYTTVNGGSNWNQVPQPNIPLPIDANEYALTDKYEAQGNTIRFATTFGRIFTSNDFGTTWTVSQTPIPDFGGGINGSGEASFSFNNNNEGLIISDDFEFFRTNNDGQTWASESTPEALRNFQICNVPNTTNTYFSIGQDNAGNRGSSYSLNGGLNWINLNDVDADPVIPTVVKFKSGTVGFCLGDYNSDTSFGLKFFKLTDPLNRLTGNLTTTNFDKISAVLFPNPTRDFVKISGISIQKIAIADVQGKTLFSQSYPVSDEIILDLSALQNGVYLAKVFNEQGNSNTLKIVKN